jgi:hypothetical protein
VPAKPGEVSALCKPGRVGQHFGAGRVARALNDLELSVGAQVLCLNLGCPVPDAFQGRGF